METTEILNIIEALGSERLFWSHLLLAFLAISILRFVKVKLQAFMRLEKLILSAVEAEDREFFIAFLDESRMATRIFRTSATIKSRARRAFADPKIDFTEAYSLVEPIFFPEGSAVRTLPSSSHKSFLAPEGPWVYRNDRFWQRGVNRCDDRW